MRSPRSTPIRARSQLSVPATSPRFFDKAASSAADVVMIDLEDAVPNADKAEARQRAAWALREIDWGDRLICVRVNGVGTPFMYRDVIEVLEGGGGRVDMLLVPKIDRGADIYAVQVLVDQVEAAVGSTRPVRLEVLIESAAALANIHEIASASSRLDALHFGSGDLAASLGFRTQEIGAVDPRYAVLGPGGPAARTRHLGDIWHYARARLVVAARTNGLRPMDGPMGNIADLDGFTASAEAASAMGFEGKWAIHPTQIAPANRAFTPTPDEVVQARNILAALQSAEEEGRGAALLNGRMIDAASIIQARRVLARAEL